MHLLSRVHFLPAVPGRHLYSHTTSVGVSYSPGLPSALCSGLRAVMWALSCLPHGAWPQRISLATGENSRTPSYIHASWCQDDRTALPPGCLPGLSPGNHSEQLLSLSPAGIQLGGVLPWVPPPLNLILAGSTSLGQASAPTFPPVLSSSRCISSLFSPHLLFFIDDQRTVITNNHVTEPALGCF